MGGCCSLVVAVVVDVVVVGGCCSLCSIMLLMLLLSLLMLLWVAVVVDADAVKKIKTRKIGEHRNAMPSKPGKPKLIRRAVAVANSKLSPY